MPSTLETLRAHRRRIPTLPVVALALLLGLPAPVDAREDAPGAPLGLRVAGVVGQVVTLAWVAPQQGAAPTSYLLSGGAVPGETLAVIPIDGPRTTFTFTAPVGAWFIRLQAQAGDVAGPPGDEVALVVGVSAPPATPRNFSAQVGDGMVALSWDHNPDGGAPTGIVLQAVGTLTGAVPVGLTGRMTFVGVPAGAYTLSLVAVNDGGASAPTAPLAVVVAEATDGTSSPQAIDASAVRVRYQPLDAPRLDELAGRERLTEVAAGGTEWERMLALKDWTAAQFPEGNPDPYPPWDAMTILDWIRGGITGGFCGQYSQVLLQALASQGYTARYLEVGTPYNPANHYVVEVWSNHFEKWVMLDAAFNLHFERAGVPQSALEIHDALLDGRADDLEVAFGAVREGHPAAEAWALRTAELYYYVRLHLKADHLSAPAEAPFDRYNDMVEWADDRVVPWESSPVPTPFRKERLTRYRTFDRMAFDAPLNRISASATRRPDGALRLEVSADVLQLDHYEGRERYADGGAGHWQPFTAQVIEVALPSNVVAVELRGVNVRGVAGPVERVALEPQP